MNDPLFLFAVVFSAGLLAAGVYAGLYHGLRERPRAAMAPATETQKLVDALVTTNERVSAMCTDIHDRMMGMHETGWRYTVRKQDINLDLARVEMQQLSRESDIPVAPPVMPSPSPQPWSDTIAATGQSRT